MIYNCLLDIWKISAKKFGNNIAFTDNKNEIQISYAEALKEISYLVEKFNRLGISKSDKISLFAVNSPRWLIFEQAIITSGAISVAKTSELNNMELNHIFTNSDSCALITDDKEVLKYLVDKNEDFNTKIKFVIFLGEKNTEIDKICKNIIYFSDILNEINNTDGINYDIEENRDDVAYINYTSGTSSTPKGVMLTNGNMLYVVEELVKLYNLQEETIYADTFPLSSTGAKAFNYICLAAGSKIIYTPYKDFYDVLEEDKPDYLLCAPKIIQTMYFKLQDKVKEESKLFQMLFNSAYNFSTIMYTFEYTYLAQNKFKFIKPLFNKIKNTLYKFLFKRIKTKMFKENVIIFVGSAHLAKRFETFLHIMQISLVQNYGLTEMSGIQFTNTKESQRRKPYTVGKTLDGTYVKIVDPETKKELNANDYGLILIKGPAQMKGYYKLPEITSKIILENGYLNTGDLGYLDKDGYLSVLSRYDDVIVMSNGYNVYIPLIENEAKSSKYIKQLIIVGHGQPYLALLVVLNDIEYRNWCIEKNISTNTDPNKNEVFKRYFIDHINEVIKKKKEYKYYEKIKKVLFIEKEFTVENGLLTGTLKTKYRKICNLYSKQIENLYGEKTNA